MVNNELAPDSPARRLLTLFLSGRCEATLREYGRGLRQFGIWLGPVAPEVAIERLLSGGQGEATRLILQYQAAMTERGLAPTTTNALLTPIRSVLRMARATGIIQWAVDIPQLRVTPYRDTRGPGTEAVKQMISVVYLSRDKAILRLLYDLALRTIEVVRLDVDDYREDRLMVMGKGRRECVALTMPDPTRLALKNWLADRGSGPGPLFTSLDPVHSGNRLTGRSIRRIVWEAGVAAGIPNAHPHQLRHSSITAALDLTGGDVRSVQRFSRHRDLRTLVIYDDSRRDDAGRIAAMVAEGTLTSSPVVMP